jgi:5'-3' exonuclease
MTLLAIDGLNVVRRIYEAIPVEDSPEKVVGAFKSCMGSFRRALSEIRPSHAIAVFDYGGPTWRHELYDQYKINRAPMPEHLKAGLPMLMQDLEDSGLPWVSVPKVEADDVMGALVDRWCEYSDEDAVIMSTDKDMVAKLSKQVRIRDHFTPAWRDEDWCMNYFGVGPELVQDFLALTGDKADGIPGVYKVGKKTAASWLKEYGSFDGVLSNSEKITGKVGEYLRRDKELAILSRKLVEFKTDITIGLTWKKLLQTYPEG